MTSPRGLDLAKHGTAKRLTRPSAKKLLKQSQKQLAVCPKDSRYIQSSNDYSPSVPRSFARTAHWTGPWESCSPTAACFLTAIQFDSLEKTANEEHSATVMLCSSMARQARRSHHSITSTRPSRGCAFTTHRLQSRPASALSMGTPLEIPICSSCGKPSLATSLMSARSTLINSSHRLNESGGGTAGSSACCLTATKAWGPEHSSARLERFLQLCANDNIEVAIPTTPAQMFHLLRRQMRRAFRKPLIVLTPKSLLRHRRAVSSVAELTTGQFHRVLADPSEPNAADVRRVLLCSGKIALDLMTSRDENPPEEPTAIIRLEQLYPLPRGADSRSA